MNKTISISIGGRNFFVEEQAFQKLDAYLKAIKAHFAAQAGSEEIVSDIENRMAEKFSENTKNNSQAVVTLTDVNNIIAELGTVDDITSEGGNSSHTRYDSADSSVKRRLMRNGDDKIIAGVCSGIAAYFDIDPFVVRCVFGLLIFAWGTIIPIYLLLWIIMPEAKTATEKMQMRGQPLNLDSISQNIKEKAQEFKEQMHKHAANFKSSGEKDANSGPEKNDGDAEVKKNSKNRLSGFFRQIGQGISSLILGIVKIAGKLIGLFIIITGALATAGLTFVGAVAIFNADSPYLNFPLGTIPHDVIYYIFIFLAYLLLLIPLQFFILLGSSIFGRSKSFTASAGLGMLGIWLAALIIGGVMGIKYFPGYASAIQNSPQMQDASKTYEVLEFKSVNLSNSNNYKLIQGGGFGVKAEGTAYELEKLEVKIEDGVLSVDNKNEKFCFFCWDRGVAVEITAPTFENINGKNSSRITGENITATSTTITLSNSSRADFGLNVKDLNLKLSNSSRAVLAGSVETLKANLSNSSRLDATLLQAKDAEVVASNSSRANVNVSQNLLYKTTNSSRIYYSGQPHLQGTGSVTSFPEPDEFFTPFEPTPPSASSTAN